MNHRRFTAPIIAAALVATGALVSSGATNAQEEVALADHPNVGAWLVATPVGPALAVFSADGTVVQGVPTTQSGPGGVTFVSAEAGTWEGIEGEERGAHFTAVQLLSDADGTFTGTVTIDAYQTVSEDGQTFMSDDRTSVTIRDADNNVVDVIEGGPPAIGTRMAVGAPGFPEPAAEAASPAP
jgi:hypothetical protein